MVFSTWSLQNNDGGLESVIQGYPVHKETCVQTREALCVPVCCGGGENRQRCWPIGAKKASISASDETSVSSRFLLNTKIGKSD